MCAVSVSRKCFPTNVASKIKQQAKFNLANSISRKEMATDSARETDTETAQRGTLNERKRKRKGRQSDTALNY